MNSRTECSLRWQNCEKSAQQSSWVGISRQEKSQKQTEGLLSSRLVEAQISLVSVQQLSWPQPRTGKIIALNHIPITQKRTAATHLESSRFQLQLRFRWLWIGFGTVCSCPFLEMVGKILLHTADKHLLKYWRSCQLRMTSSATWRTKQNGDVN